MPAGDGITFTYGNYAFDPRPLFTVNKEIIKTPANTGLATKYSLVLQGTLAPTGIDPITGRKGGLSRVMSSGTALRSAFDQDFKLLKLQCDSDDPIINAYPKVVSIDIQNASDNFVRRLDYTINLELPSLTGNASEPVGIDCDGDILGNLANSGLIALTEDVTVEFLDERIGGGVHLFNGTLPSVFSIQRNLSAQGNPLSCGPGSTYTQPWEYAKAYVESNLGLQPEMTGLTELMCVRGMNIASSFRSIGVNKSDGSVNATETFIAFTGQYPATEEFEVSTDRSLDSPFTTVSINGTVQGLANISYAGGDHGCTPTGTLKFNNALAAWSGISGSIFPRAIKAHDVATRNLVFATGGLNIYPLSESIGYNPIVGSITYNYTYDNRVVNCYTGAITEDISFTYNEPNDTFASLTVLGRTHGPLFQAINTSGATTREISINALIPVEQINPELARTDPEAWARYAVPFDGYNDFISMYEAQLALQYQQVFVNSHTQTWDPKLGNYTLNKAYTVGYCV